MSSTTAFVGDVPRVYDSHFGPFFFEFYAKDLASRVEKLKPRTLLTLACGTGIDTHAARQAWPHAEIVATDLNPDMLKVAAAKFQPGEVQFQVVDAQSLPFPDGRFDAITCQFGLMFVPDKNAALREALRVLSPGGSLIVSVWDSLEENPFVKIAHDVLQEICATNPPQFWLTPFGLFDHEVLRNLFETNGFTNVELDVMTCYPTVSDSEELAYGFIYGSPAYGQIVDHPEIDVKHLQAELARRFAEALSPEKTTKLQAIVVSGRKGN